MNAESIFVFNEEKLLAYAAGYIQFCDFKISLSLYKLLTILAAMPVRPAAATTECSFNRLRCVKAII